MADLYMIALGSKPCEVGAKEVGGKAWGLMRMTEAGLPIPPAFVLPTSWCGRKDAEDQAVLRQRLLDGIAKVEAAAGLEFGATRRPLLVSVRSGGAVSMPGMMETVLNIGLNAGTVKSLIRTTGNPRLAWDSYRRLVQSYAEVVANLPTAPFDALVASALTNSQVDDERDLDHRDLRTLTTAMLDCYRALAGSSFPVDPHDQLASATAAVFRSWDAPKAVTYRRLNQIEDSAGTAVTVQAMVFGNAGGQSGSGVGFTRNPAVGTKEFYFDFQFNAQGEDIVAGRQHLGDQDRLRTILPEVWDRLNTICHNLEGLFRDAQDFEFTVQSGKLFLLQTRRVKRTDWAALAIAVDMVAEGVITPDEALANIEGIKLDSVVRTSFAPPVPETLAVAEVASMGVASGVVALDSEAVKRFTEEGSTSILVRTETVTTDIEGMALAAGILTASGGRTSHAAVVARQLGKVCLVACPELSVDLDKRQCTIGKTVLKEGDLLSLDGNTGAVHLGRLTPVIERPEQALAAIASWHPSA
jgi:pyruvate,orthophosphate dikinase